MGAINYMPTHHDHHLLALAVFVDPLRTDYVRSIHVHEENVGSLHTMQQDFLLNPGECVRISQPMISRSFRTYMWDTGVKQIMDSITKIHHDDGWHCVLNYRSDSPSADAYMPYLLLPSRNVDLKNVPSLELDLKVVEKAVMSSSKNTHNMLNDDETITGCHRPYGGDGKAMCSSGLTLSCPSSLAVSGHLNDCIPGLETPERTPHGQGQQLDIWQNWGSELELASAEISHNRTSQSRQATPNSSIPMPSQNAGYVGALWNPSTLLDLNLELTEFPSQDKDIDCTLGLCSTISKPESFLNLQLGLPLLSLQASTTIAEENMDCFTLECFGDSPPSYKNMVSDLNMAKPTKATTTQSAKSMCSEDTVDCHECVINMSPWDVNGNSSMASNNMHSTALEKSSGCVDDHKTLKNSPTSINMYSVPQMTDAEYDKMSKGCHATSSDMYRKNAAYSSVDMVFKHSPATSITSSDIYSAGYLNGDKGSPATSSENSLWGQGKENSGRTSCSSISTQSVGQGPSKPNTGNKLRIIRPGTTSERLPEITLQELSQYFSMPITQAAKELKIGLTVLKKRCRKFGIPRWPHRKMKSIDSLIYNIQGLAEDQGAKSSPRVRNAVRELEEQKKLMEEMPGVELAERTKRLRQACFKANYKKRKLGMMAVNNAPSKPPDLLSPALALSFNILNPSVHVVAFPPEPSHHGSLPLIPTSSDALR